MTWTNLDCVQVTDKHRLMDIVCVLFLFRLFRGSEVSHGKADKQHLGKAMLHILVRESRYESEAEVYSNPLLPSTVNSSMLPSLVTSSCSERFRHLDGLKTAVTSVQTYLKVVCQECTPFIKSKEVDGHEFILDSHLSYFLTFSMRNPTVEGRLLTDIRG